MKLTYNLFVAFASLFILSCGQSAPVQKSEQKASNENNLITFKVNGAPVTTSGWNISRFDMGHGLNLNITTNMHHDKRTLMFNLKGCATGTYKIGEATGDLFSGYGDYKPDYSDLLTSYQFEKGEFSIDEIDTAKGILNAHFFGTVKKGSEQFEITDGVIKNGNLSKGVQTY